MKFRTYSLLLLWVLAFSIPIFPQEQVASSFSVKDIHLFEWIGNEDQYPLFKSDLNSYTLLSVNESLLSSIVSEKPDRLSLALPFEGGIGLVLERRQLTAPGFKVWAGGVDEKQEIPYEEGAYYQGYIQNEHQTGVAISFFEHDIIGVIFDQNQGAINLGVIDVEDMGTEMVAIVYRDSELKSPPPFECSVGQAPEVKNKDLPSFQDAYRTVTLCFSSYLECDYALYLAKGSVGNSVNFITGVYLAVALLYDNEQIHTTISEVFVWTSPDGYPTNDSNDALDAFSNAMDASGFNGNLAHLVSMNNNNLGGRAWINTICNPGPKYRTAYSNIDPTYLFPPPYSWTVNVMTHEIGHNLSSRHTHACVWNGNNTQIDDFGNLWAYNNGDTPEGNSCFNPNNPILPANGGTIMSYGHLNPAGMNFSLGFGSQPGNMIRNTLTNCSDCSLFAPPNDLCANAIIVGCGQSINGNTYYATTTGAPASCVTPLNTSGGLWYKFIGTGQIITASLCGSSYDTKIGVFTGSCSNLICITGNDDFCGHQSEVEFATTAGTTYYIYVTGFDTEVGAFTLNISCSSTVRFDVGEECGAVGQTVQVPVFVRNFNDIAAYQFSFHVDNPAIASIIGVSDIYPVGILGYNSINSHTWTFVWDDPTANGVLLPDSTIIFKVNLLLSGNPGQSSTLTINNTPTDFVVSNSGATQVPAISIGGSICVNQLALIRGNIYKESGQGIALATVLLSGDATASYVTNASGFYEFNNLSIGGNYFVTPGKDINYINGVNVLDITRIRQYILGTNGFSSPYRYIAADVTNDHSINVIDITQIRQLILGIISDFPNNTSWRFVSTDYAFPPPPNSPLSGNIQEQRSYQPILVDKIDEDFIGIKIGDVNDDCNPLSFTGELEERELPTKAIVVRNKRTTEGEISVDLLASSFQAIIGFQFTLQYDPEVLVYEEVSGVNLPGFGPASCYHMEDKGIITFAWTDPLAMPNTLEDEEALLELVFSAKVPGVLLSDILSIIGVPTEALIFNKMEQGMRLNLDFRDLGLGDSHLVVLPPKPNPFGNQTTIGFFLPAADAVSLEVFDLNGREVFKTENFYSEGENQFMLNGTDLPGPGIYFFRVSTSNETATNRLARQ
jgi:hypothetical protein